LVVKDEDVTMKIKIYLFACLICLAALQLQCSNESDRRIRLATRAENGLMKEKVATIQVAVAKKKSIAVLRFVNRTRQESLDWLEQGIIEMLAADLSQSRQLNLLPSDRVAQAFKELAVDKRSAADSAVALMIAQHLNAEAFVSGAYFLRHDSLFIELELHDSKNGALMSKEIVGGGGLENVFTMMDQIAKNLRGDLQITMQETREVDHSIADFMTKSVDAYKYYALGIDAANKLYYDEAMSYFEKAIAEDSSFASAYLHLAICYSHINNLERARSLLAKAVASSGSTTTKERLNILAMAALTNGDIPQAIEIYMQITELFPEDDEAHYNLGTYYESFGMRTRAIEQLEAAVAMNPENKLAHNQLAYVYAKSGKIDYAFHSLKKYLKLAPDEPNPYDSMGEILQMEGRIDEAIPWYKKALSKNDHFKPSWLHLAGAYLDNGEVEKVFKTTKKYLLISESKDDSVQALAWMAKAFLAQGDLPQAVHLLVEGLKIKPENDELLWGLAVLDPDSIANCRRLGDRIKFEVSSAKEARLSFENLFDLVALSLKQNCHLEDAENLLNRFLASATNSITKQGALAYKNVVELYQRRPNRETSELLSDRANLKTLLALPRISWEGYWRYFALGITRSFPNKLIVKDSLAAARDYLRAAGSTQFDLGLTFALSMLNELQGNRRAAEYGLTTIGAPPEDAWHVCGPFKINKGFQERYRPEEIRAEELLQKSDEKMQWITNPDRVMDGYVNLRTALGNELNSAVYALLRLNSPTSRNLQLRFGANKPMKVWLNNDLALTKNFQQPAVMDETIVLVHLNVGTNTLLVKMNVLGGEAGFYFRATNEAGKGMPDITYGDEPLAKNSSRFEIGAD